MTFSKEQIQDFNNWQNLSPRPTKRSAMQKFQSIHLDKESYTSGQVARMLGIPPRTIRRYLSIGKIAADQNPITQTWQISRKALSQFIEEQGGTVVAAFNDIKVLLMNNDPAITEVLHRISGEYRPDFKLYLPENPVDALILCGAIAPDALVVDLSIPVLEGPSFISALRKNQFTEKIRIVALAGHEDIPSELEMLGADKVVFKPFSDRDLLHILDEIFPRPATLEEEQ